MLSLQNYGTDKYYSKWDLGFFIFFILVTVSQKTGNFPSNQTLAVIILLYKKDVKVVF